jgi:small subunit ribosomal protein S16
MALKIRLRQQGRKNAQTYRVVVADAKVRRDGKYVEKLGWYLPTETENNCSLDGERVKYWVGLGAQMSEQVETLMAQVAPEVLKELRQGREAAKLKKVAKRRKLKKASA